MTCLVAHPHPPHTAPWAHVLSRPGAGLPEHAARL